MPQQVGKFDFTGIPAASQASTAPADFDFGGIAKPAPDVPTHPHALFGQAVIDLLTGAAKGAGRTAVGLGRLVSEIPGAQRVLSPIPSNAEETLGLTPTNTAQKIGMTGEQIAEFFVPASKVTQAVRGVTGGGLLPTVVSEAATAYGVAKAQGDESAGVTAAMGGAGPVVGRGLYAIGSRAADKLRASGVQDVLHALNPTTRKMKAKADRVAPEVQKRGITGSIEDVQDLAKTNRQSLGEDIDAALTRSFDKPVDLSPVRTALNVEKAKTYNMVRQPDGVSKAVVHDRRKAAQLEKFEQLLDEYGDTMTTEQAVAVRRTWDDIVERAGGYDEKATGAFGVTLDDASEAGVARPLAKALRGELTKTNPDVAALNKEFKFWKDLEAVSSATQTRRVGQRRDLTTKVVRAGAMAAGAASAPSGIGGVAGGLLAGETAARAERLFTSPRFKLLSAREKGRLADALESGGQERIGAAIGRATAAMSGITPMPAHAR